MVSVWWTWSHLFILSSFQLSSKHGCRMGMQVQCCSKCPPKSILYFDIFTNIVDAKRNRWGGYKFDMCEANICCYRNNCHFILSHKATSTALKTSKKMKFTRNEAVLFAPYPAKQQKAREIDKSLGRDQRDFKAARLIWLTQEPCSTVKTLCENLK